MFVSRKQQKQKTQTTSQIITTTKKQRTKCPQNARIITLLNFSIYNYIIHLYNICRHIYIIVFIFFYFKIAMQTYLSLLVVHFYVYHSYNLCNCVFYSSLMLYIFSIYVFCSHFIPHIIIINYMFVLWA